MRHKKTIKKLTTSYKRVQRVIRKSPKAWVAGIGVVVIAAAGAFLFLKAVPNYTLTDADKRLLSAVPANIAKQLTLDGEKMAYVYTPEAKTETSVTVGPDGSGYEVEVPRNPNEPVSYKDIANDVSFTMKPKFGVHSGQRNGDHLVYPLTSNGGWLVYTLQYNGLKEDIILNKKPGKDELRFSYQLDLPDSLEARLENDGAVGVYGADASLLSEVSVSNDKDRELLAAARKKAPKNNLLFVIPAPIVTDKNVSARFELEGKTLTTVASNLKAATYPLSIDPSIVTPADNGFSVNSTGSGFISYNSDGSISRDELGGGNFGAWANDDDPLLNTPNTHTTFISNGFIYVIGGKQDDSTPYFNSYYAPVNADGTIGGWVTTTPLPFARAASGKTYYNGYVYFTGGGNDDNKVIYGKVLPEGGIESWQQGTVLPRGKTQPAAAAYNGYLYVAGGCVFDNDGGAFGNSQDYCGLDSDEVYYAKIHPDGSVSSWQETTPLLTSRYSYELLTHNGYMYAVGGCQMQQVNSAICEQYRNDVLITRINDDGTVGDWTTSPINPSGRHGHAAVIAKGYIYMEGGQVEGQGYSRSTLYTPIYADGSLGAWEESGSLTTEVNGITGHTLDYYNGRLYSVAGRHPSNPAVYYNNVRIANIQPAGYTKSYTVPTTIGERWAHESIIVNDYLYVIGGCVSVNDNCGTITNSVIFAKINSDGTLGSWTNTTGLPDPRAKLGVTAYNGQIYVVGGCSVTFGSCTNNNGDTFYADPNPSTGQISGWSTDSTNPLTNSRRDHALVAYNDRVYAIGGYVSGATNSVEMASINGDGSLTAWQSVSSLGQSRYIISADVSHGRIYVAGGVSGAGNRFNMEYAEILSGGGLGAWVIVNGTTPGQWGIQTETYNGHVYQVAGNGVLDDVFFNKINPDGSVDNSYEVNRSLNTEVTYHAAEIYRGYVYVVSGCLTYDNANAHCDTMTPNVQVAEVNNGGNGSLDEWTIDSTDTAAGRAHAQHVVINGYMYLLGGCTSGTQFTCSASGAVEYAKINQDGSLGAWSNASIGISPRGAHGAVAYGGRIYVVGGCSGTPAACSPGDYVRSIQFATPQSDGDIASWSTNSIDLPISTSYFGLDTHDGYMYRIGGQGYTGTTAYAPIDVSTGEVGAWDDGTNLNQGVYNHGVAIYGGYIYAVNGNDGVSTPGSRVVQSAKINSDHSLEPWVTVSYTNNGTQEAAVAAYNGYLYRVQGYGDATGIEYAPILPEGQVGEWQRTATTTYPKYLSTAPIWEGRIYSLPNLDAAGNRSPYQEYASLNVIHQKATFSQLIDMQDAHSLTRFKYITQNGCDVGVKYSDAANGASAFPAMEDLGSSSANTYIGIEPENLNSRYISVQFTLDDSKCATYGGEGSKVNNYEFFYRPGAGSRLRGGKNFMNGQQRQFDTEQGATLN